jgi:hypothetical protein
MYRTIQKEANTYKNPQKLKLAYIIDGTYTVRQKISDSFLHAL